MRIALRAKPRERIMLVTDALASVGMSEQEFLMQGRRIRVVDGVCVDENGTLAGSALDMASAVRNLVAYCGASLEDAVAMASGNPAAFLGLAGETGAIGPGLRADLVAADTAMTVHRVWIAGEEAPGA